MRGPRDIMAVRTPSAVPHGRPAPEVLVGPESLWDIHSALREPLALATLWPSRPGRTGSAPGGVCPVKAPLEGATLGDSKEGERHPIARKEVRVTLGHFPPGPNLPSLPPAPAVGASPVSPPCRTPTHHEGLGAEEAGSAGK